MPCTNCESTIPTPVLQSTVPCLNCGSASCTKKVAGECVRYQYGKVNAVSRLSTLALPSYTDYDTILEKIDSILGASHIPVITDCFRSLAQIPTTSTTLGQLLTALQNQACINQQQDRYVGVNASDTNVGYLADKLIVGDCLVVNPVTVLNKVKLKVTLDVQALLLKIGTDVALKAQFAALVGNGGSIPSPTGCQGQSTAASWVDTSTTRCSGLTEEKQQIDQNPCSATYNTTRYIATGNASACQCNGQTAQANWTDVGATRCNGFNLEKSQKDTNACSNTYNTFRWLLVEQNSVACYTACITVQVKNTVTVDGTITFLNCNNNSQVYTLPANTQTTICGKAGSFSATSGITVITTSTECSVTAIPTPTPVTPVTPVSPTPVSPVTPNTYYAIGDYFEIEDNSTVGFTYYAVGDYIELETAFGTPVTPVTPAPSTELWIADMDSGSDYIPDDGTTPVTPVSPVSPVSPAPVPTGPVTPAPGSGNGDPNESEYSIATINPYIGQFLPNLNKPVFPQYFNAQVAEMDIANGRVRYTSVEPTERFGRDDNWKWLILTEGQFFTYTEFSQLWWDFNYPVNVQAGLLNSTLEPGPKIGSNHFGFPANQRFMTI